MCNNDESNNTPETIPTLQNISLPDNLTQTPPSDIIHESFDLKNPTKTIITGEKKIK